MKNKTARREIESLDYYLQNHTDDYSEESHTAMMMAKDALNNADVLEQIRQEITNDIHKCNNTDMAFGMQHTLDIIDKYKEQTE